MTRLIDTATKDRFANFLNTYRGTPVGTLRLHAVRACLKAYNVERASQLTPEQAEAIANALTIPCAENIEDLLEAPFPEPGPAFKMSHVERIHEATQVPSNLIIAFLEDKAEDRPLFEIVTKIADKRGDETRAYAARLVGQMTSAYNQIVAEEADERGELWHVRAAIYTDRVFMVLRQGFEPEGWEEAFESQHRKTIGFGQKRIIGNQRDAQIESLKLFFADEATIRVLRK